MKPLRNIYICYHLWELNCRFYILAHVKKKCLMEIKEGLLMKHNKSLFNGNINFAMLYLFIWLEDFIIGIIFVLYFIKVLIFVATNTNFCYKMHILQFTGKIFK